MKEKTYDKLHKRYTEHVIESEQIRIDVCRVLDEAKTELGCPVFCEKTEIPYKNASRVVDPYRSNYSTKKLIECVGKLL